MSLTYRCRVAVLEKDAAQAAASSGHPAAELDSHRANRWLAGYTRTADCGRRSVRRDIFRCIGPCVCGMRRMLVWHIALASCLCFHFHLLKLLTAWLTGFDSWWFDSKGGEQQATEKIRWW